MKKTHKNKKPEPLFRSIGSGKALAAGAAFLLLAIAPALADAAAPLRAADEQALSDQQLLGKRIFEDVTLSEPQGMSCASCHAPEHAFQGNNKSPIAAVALGSTPDKVGTRKTPTLMYKAYSPAFGFYIDADGAKPKLEPRGGQFWDGRAADLAEQASGPLLNPLEMNNPSAEAVVAKIARAPYADLAKTLYGPEVFADPKAAMGKMMKSVAAFELSPRFAPFSSKFDDWLRGKTELTAEEKRGYAIFIDTKKSNCVDCHAGKPESKDPTDWIFSDFSYHVLGVPRNAAIPANANPEVFDLGLCKRPGLEAILPKKIKLASLCGAFKAPTLRNVAVTGPYFHNGAFPSLRDAVAFYATRETDPGHWYPRDAKGKIDKFNDLPKAYKASVNVEDVPYDRKPGQRPRLNDQEIDALVAFLKTLTDRGMN
ncbi:cytochrome c peroxidase [uncultured Rhodoblastus sp.]|uniref:cytochrome-c peroxidase n=1 Tax=uncultured Rhodoblastus sp. TaxID=543037 RepID=UPI0025CF544A|nr:cytochrome c peroxidase [uncultured Rhodoblastus sp.]